MPGVFFGGHPSFSVAAPFSFFFFPGTFFFSTEPLKEKDKQ